MLLKELIKRLSDVFGGESFEFTYTTNSIEERREAENAYWRKRKEVNKQIEEFVKEELAQDLPYWPSITDIHCNKYHLQLSAQLSNSRASYETLALIEIESHFNSKKSGDYTTDVLSYGQFNLDLENSMIKPDDDLKYITKILQDKFETDRKTKQAYREKQAAIIKKIMDTFHLDFDATLALMECALEAGNQAPMTMKRIIDKL